MGASTAGVFLLVLLVVGQTAATAKCNNWCTSDASCKGANDGCTMCIRPAGSLFKRCQPAPKCNEPCADDFWCTKAGTACTKCVSNKCQPPPPKCNDVCNNDNDCKGAPNGCVMCIREIGKNTKRCQPAPKCNEPCADDFWCTKAGTACTKCVNNKCSKPTTTTSATTTTKTITTTTATTTTTTKKPYSCKMYDVHGDKTKDLGIKFSMNLEKDEKKFQLRVCNKAASVQSAVTKAFLGVNEKFKKLKLKGKSDGDFEGFNEYGWHGDMEYNASLVGKRGLLPDECFYINVKTRSGGWKKFLKNKWDFAVEMDNEMYHSKCKMDEEALEAGQTSSIVSAPVASVGSSFSSAGAIAIATAGVVLIAVVVALVVVKRRKPSSTPKSIEEAEIKEATI